MAHTALELPKNYLWTNFLLNGGWLHGGGGPHFFDNLDFGDLNKLTENSCEICDANLFSDLLIIYFFKNINCEAAPQSAVLHPPPWSYRGVLRIKVR